MNSNFEYYKIFYYVAKYENLTKGGNGTEDQPAGSHAYHTQTGK